MNETSLKLACLIADCYRLMKAAPDKETELELRKILIQLETLYPKVH